MKVALDATPLTVPKTGIGEYTYQLSRHLAHRFAEDEFLLVSNFPFPPVSRPPNLRSLSCRTNWITGRWWLVGLPKLLQQEGVFVFHGTGYEIPWLPLQPCVLTIHDLSSRRLPHLHERRTRRTAQRLPWMVKHAAHIIVPTTAIQQEILEEFGTPREKVSVIPLAPGPQFRPGLNEDGAVLENYNLDRPYVLFVGTLEPRKNLTALVRAFAALPPALLDGTDLVLCGHWGWMNEGLEAEISRLRLQSKVRFLGYVPDAVLPALYAGATVLVYPSLYEGFGLPPLEAMASGVPVIVSSAPALTEVLGDAAWPVDSHDAESLRQALQNLLSSASLRNTYRQKGLAHVQKFSWQSVAEKTYAVYQKVMAENPRSKWNQICRAILDWAPAPR